jgi:hypothetical protein
MSFFDDYKRSRSPNEHSAGTCRRGGAVEILADAPVAKYLGPTIVSPDADVPDNVKEQSRRECYLDLLHARLEGDRWPKKPVHIWLFRPNGGKILFFVSTA